MGSFSFTKADMTTKSANVGYNKPFKFLIPQEFGGGYIKENYQNYGYLGTKENGSPKYDMLELFAFWNADVPAKTGRLEKKDGRLVPMCASIRNKLKYDGEFPLMKEIDEHTDGNRSFGVFLFNEDEHAPNLPMLLKTKLLVSEIP